MTAHTTDFVRISKAADHAGISTRKIYRHVKLGELSLTKHGGSHV